MRRPDFFIVGGARCGTTALKEYLEPHPDIFMPYTNLEPGFFASDCPFPYNVRSEKDYLALFAQAETEKRVGEKSAVYLYSTVAAERIKAFEPSARIIIMLRNPVEKLYSRYRHRLYMGDENIESFEEALDADRDRREGRRLPAGVDAQDARWYLYREGLRYTYQVKRYFDLFGWTQTHVIIFDEFIRSTAEVYREVLRFLEVDPDFRPAFQPVNVHRRAHSRTLHTFLTRPPVLVKSLVDRLLPQTFVHQLSRGLHRLNSDYTPRSPLSPDLVIRLQEEFRPEVEALGNLLNRDLSHWCQSSPSCAARP
jgi:hypothetical protein